MSLKTWCIREQQLDILAAFELAGNEISSESISYRSGKSVRWKCSVCGEEWEESPYCAGSRKNFCPFCSKQKASQRYNLEAVFPEVAAQWDYIRNGSRTPRNTLPHSHAKAYWTCSFNPAHQWQDRISNRTILLRDCPECAKQFHISYSAMVLYYYLRKSQIKCSCEKQAGRYFIDIAVDYLPGEDRPIALELDGYYTHNSDAAEAREIRKDSYLTEKGYRVIRIKESAVSSVRRSGDAIIYPHDPNGTYSALDDVVAYVIMYLSGIQIQPDHKHDHWDIRRLYYHEQKLRSLAVNKPDLASQWSPANKASADAITMGNQEKWLWICPKCKKEYAATIHNRVIMNSGCPLCSRKTATAESCLAATHPQIAQEWDFEKNGDKTPYNTLSGTDYPAWWRCPNGHSYQANIYERTGKDKRGCPECRSLAFRNPLLASYYDEACNPIPANRLRAYANGPCHWKCPEGHTWVAQPNNMQKRRPEAYCRSCREAAEAKKDNTQNRDDSTVLRYDIRR